MSEARQAEALEEQIVRAAQQGVAKAVEESLSGYHGPLKKLCDRVIERRSSEISELVNNGLDSVIASDKFAIELKTSIRHKLARSIVGNLTGELEKRVNDLKSNPATRARLTIALDQMIEELTTVEEDRG